MIKVSVFTHSNSWSLYTLHRESHANFSQRNLAPAKYKLGLNCRQLITVKSATLQQWQYLVTVFPSYICNVKVALFGGFCDSCATAFSPKDHYSCHVQPELCLRSFTNFIQIAQKCFQAKMHTFGLLMLSFFHSCDCYM